MTHRDKSDSVFVQFFTRLAKQYVITDDRISVPASLKRMGLSGVVNHMLGTTGKFLTLDREYRPLAPSFQKKIKDMLHGKKLCISDDEDTWVETLSVIFHFPDDSFVLTFSCLAHVKVFSYTF
eukprot:TRINITY_DN1674_c0_g1_i5.p1 TRINITY_DN1674_c0_g1~~TRINITY_DN1674_c0_g1_i5.p1  ORF type:complete len:123 (-),score=6.45 TRINITY_DN1674_c0_g1_i5:245-613(-)